MIVAYGTNFPRAVKQFVLRNWGLILAVLLTVQAILYASGRTNVLHTDVFSATAVGLFSTVVGIFIVFRFNEAYQRWWEARILWGGLVNESRSFAREVSTFITPERVPQLETMAEAEAIHRELIYRHLAYCNALRLSLRKQTSWEELAPFLSEEELGDVTGYANKATRLSFLQGRRLADLFSGGVEQAVLLARMDTTMSRLLDIQGGCERIKHTAFPDEVRFISRAMVWLTAVAIPVAFLSTRNQVHILEIIAVIIISLGFMVVEQLGASLKNPFENLDNDTPMTALCRTIEIDLRQALGETELPRPVEPVNGVLL